MIGEPQIDLLALKAKARGAFDSAARRLDAYRAAWPPDRPAPVHTREGAWYRPERLWTDWTPGFFAGQMWILARVLRSSEWLEAAMRHTAPLRARRFDRDVHDLGFIFLPSWGRWRSFLLEIGQGPEPPDDTLVTAATVQSFRWREGKGGEDGFVYSFNGPQSLFVDTLMNVPLLLRASRIGAAPEVGRRALEHARTTLRHLVRRDGPGLGEVDGSVAHEAIFNAEPGRGEFRCLSTQQGWSPFTTWSRGLAWAIYGLTEVHRWTGAAELIDGAERCARYFLREVPDDGVPFWDFGAPGIPGEPLDSSAAAVTACALQALADRVAGPESARYRRGARRILETILSEGFFTGERAGEEGLLLHGTYHRPRGWGVDAALAWGDYFFLEALERLVMGPPRDEAPGGLRPPT